MLFKNIPHKDILELHSISDIYVSTNKDGNLSNSNLEAISSNDCMLIPDPQIKDKIDLQTHSYLKGSVVYYKNNNEGDLKSKIDFLIRNPNHVKKMKENIKKEKTSFLKTWNSRINEEIDIIHNCIKEKK